MRSAQGYYSVIQYSEFPERGEFVNIGVILLSPVPPGVLLRFAKSSRRVERAFNVNLGAHFSNLKASLEERIMSEFGSRWDEDSFKTFISMRSGKVRLSPLRSIYVEDPVWVLEDLFAKLVSDIPNVRRGERVSTKLKSKLQFNGVENLLDRPEPIRLPQGVTINAPYGYQNGSYNLIDAVSLQGNPDQAIERASTFAIEGEWLYEATRAAEQKQLIMVGDIDGQQSPFVTALSDMLKKHHVKFFALNEIEPLVADIRKNFVSRQGISAMR